MKIQELKTSELKPFQRNNRRHPDGQVEKLAKQIEAHGWDVPIVVDKDFVIIKGHARLKAAKKLKLKTVPVIVRDDLTPEQCAAARLADNKLSELAEIDIEAIQAELDALQAINFDLDLTAFDSWNPFAVDAEEGAECLTDPDDVPELKPDPKSKLGDVWLLGNHRVMCGDSTDAASVAILMNGQKAEFCFTSPPYSEQREYCGNLELAPSHLAKFMQAPCKLFAVNLGMQRKNNEVVQYWDEYIRAAKEFGHKFLSWNIWNRSGFGYTVGQATAMFCIDHEWILIFGERKELNKTLENKQSGLQKKGTIRQKDGNTTAVFTETHTHRQLGTVITKDVARYVGDDHTHPAMFPVELVEDYLLSCSNGGDVIFEPFTGSGSTLIACEKTGRHCYGMEISPQYVDVILKRWQDFTGKKAVREDGVEFDHC